MEITGTINVTELSAVDKLNDTDTLLLIRKEGESQKCYRIAGSDFRGKSAYEVARDAGYEGTFVEWNWYTTNDMIDSCFTVMIVTAMFYIYGFFDMFISRTKLGRKICA